MELTMDDQYSAHRATAFNYQMLAKVTERMHTQQMAMLAEFLTSRSSEWKADFKEFKAIEGKQQKQRVAEQMIKALEKEIKASHAKVEQLIDAAYPDDRDRLQTILTCIDERAFEELSEYGLDVHYAWLNDVVASLIQGSPVVDIHVSATEPAVSTDAANGFMRFAASKMTPKDMLCIELTSLLRKISPKLGRIRMVITINDLFAVEADRHLTPDERNNYVVDMLDFLAHRGSILPNDIPGKDYIVIRASEQVAQVDELIARLDTSKHGRVVYDTQGNTYFRPTRRLIETLALKGKASREELVVAGVIIRRYDGSLSPQALDAITFLDDEVVQGLHLIMIDEQLAFEQDKTYALIRALDAVHQEDHHNVFFASDNLPAEIVYYWISKVLEQYIQEFLFLLNRYDEWQMFDPYEYAMRNYGKEIVVEDIQIINGIIAACAHLGLVPQSLEHIADVGTGSNLYPLMLTVPFLKRDAKIDVLEFTQSNREYLQKTAAGTVGPDHATIWDKFEQLMVEVGGEQYAGSMALAKQKANIQFGDIFNLPKAKYDLVSSYFVAESIVDSHLPFRTAIKSLAQAIKPETGILMIAHMLESEGYFAGVGTNFPAVKLTVNQLAEAYRDADLDFVIVPVSDNGSDYKVREGYHGMAFVVATPRHSNRQTQAALDMVAKLPGSQRSVTTYEYSVEYCHIYTNEQVGTEHAQSLEKLSTVVSELDERLASYNLCVMVDDYTFPKENFDYAKLLEWMDAKGARPHFWLKESDLITAADEVIDLITDQDRKKSLKSYVAKKKYPCSLLIAAWYLARLGKLKTMPSAVTSTAERLINILPTRFDPFEVEAREILASTPFKDVLAHITNEYLEDYKSNY